jgi:hypothetical protein
MVLTLNRLSLATLFLSSVLGACSSIGTDPVAISPNSLEVLETASNSTQLRQTESSLNEQALNTMDLSLLEEVTLGGVIQKLPVGNRIGRLNGFWQIGEQQVFVRNRTEIKLGSPSVGDVVQVVARQVSPTVFIAVSIESGVIIQRATGSTPEEIAPTITQFQATLGGVNHGGDPTAFPDGFRTINWDAVPDQFASPAAFAGDFFNTNFSPRARGAVFTEVGENLASNEFEVSARVGVQPPTPTEFANLNLSYADLFRTFSPERLFAYTADDDTSFDVIFFVPGTVTTPATVKGFGAVFTDVDQAGKTQLEYFDAQGKSILTQAVPPANGNESLSFLGVFFPEGIKVSRVRITSGSQPIGLAAEEGVRGDLVVMDDFIYSEPQP